MASAWDKAKEVSDQASESNYLRLEDDGDKAIIVCREDPITKLQYWNPKTERNEDFTEQHKKDGKTARPKFLINAYAFSVTLGGKDATPHDAKRALIWEMNNSTFKDLLKVREKYGLDAQVFEVERKGKKGDKQTTYSILPERKLTDGDKKLMAAAPVHDLNKSTDDESTDASSYDKKKESGGKAKTNGTAPSAPVAEAISKDEATGIIDRLKKLPKANIESFLKHFQVGQVKLLKPGALADAHKMLAEFESAAAPAAEVDPFA